MGRSFMFFKICLLMAFSGSALFGKLAFAIDRTIEVVFVRTADSDGSNPSQATAEEFIKQIDAANVTYAGSGLQFKFNPAKDFPPIVNSTWLNRDFVLASGETLDSPADKQPKINSLKYTQVKNDYAVKNFAGKMVVYSGAGTQISYDKNISKWVIAELGGAYSNAVDRYVRWHKFNDTRPYLFAHEGGHHLHLGHTFGWQPETLKDWRKIVTDFLKNNGNKNDIINLFDGDGLSDTPADPGAGLFNLINGETCGNKDELSLSYVLDRGLETVTFKPDRTNVMGYFFCDNFFPHISPQQKSRAFKAVEYGNRNYLHSLNLGINIPHYSPNIEAISWGANRLDLFASGSDLKVFHKAYDGANGGWNPKIEEREQWWAHGGESVGTPSAVSWGENRIDLFVRNINGSIQHQAWNGSSWYPSDHTFENMGGVFAGDIKAVSWEANRIDLFGRGFDGKIYHKAWDGSQWWPSLTGWNKLGNETATSDPVAVSWGDNRLDVFIRGQAGDVMIKSWDGSQWWPKSEDWASLGGQIPFGSKPAVTAWGPERLDIVVRGMDNAIWHKAYSNGNWYPSLLGWNTLGGAATSDPSMVSWGANRLDIIVRGTDAKLYHKAWDGSNWWPSLLNWTSLGGAVLEGSTPKILSWKPGRLDIIIRDFNFEIQYKAYENSWYPGLLLFEKQGKYID